MSATHHMLSTPEKHSVARLVGALRGTSAIVEASATEAVRRRHLHRSADVEAAAPPRVIFTSSVVLDDGRLTDTGRTVDFRNTILPLTPNSDRSSWQNQDLTTEENGMEYVRRPSFRPEFLNRLDETVMFGCLDPRKPG